MIYTYDYDSTYLPAMPIVTLSIGRSDSDALLALSALVDSGADATMIPVNYLKQVNAIKRQHVLFEVFPANDQAPICTLYLYSLLVTTAVGSMWSAIKIQMKSLLGELF